jgi:DNA polymerase-3 subunit gamma/tau
VSHTALARKYRPRRFGEVATQEHVSETLRKAVAGDRVGHAYLFCGPRGVGKTTLARVLAMALNCPNRAADGEPCGDCQSCQRIWGGHTSLDVVEIDAASNRGVDDARNLRERAMYAPSDDQRHKVYIVDEAHMLTREAWNALLKILEEPPPRVIFIFATTEPQKIQQSAAPILSRCQRFDFRRIGIAEIVSRLEAVLGGEGAKGSPDALRAIARKADGGMRDALSILDQVLSLTGGEVSLDAVRLVLGLVEEERLLELFEILSERRHAEVFRFIESLVEDGYDLVEAYHALMDGIRLLLRLALEEDATALELPEHLVPAFRERADTFAVGDLVRMLSLASDLETSGNLRRSPNPRALIEMLLLRISYLDRTIAIEELVGAVGGSGSPGGAAGSSHGASGSRGPAVSRKGTTRAREQRGSSDSPASVQSKQTPARVSSKPTGSATPIEAWASLLETGAGVPPGLGPFLRTARVTPTADGLLLELPPGPGLDRISQPATKSALREALGQFLPVDLEVEVGALATGSAEGPPRVTQETVRQTRLQELKKREPLLEHAVEELDLELME